MLSIILAAALQASAAPPVSPSPGQAPTEVAPVTATGQRFGVVEGRHQPKDETICLADAVTGSKIPKKRCMTREQFEQRRQEARDHTEAIQRDARAPISK